MAQHVLKLQIMYKLFLGSIFFMGFLWVMLPQITWAQAMCTGPTGAVCAGCEIPGNDSSQWSWVQKTIKNDMLDAKDHIIKALNDAQDKIVSAIQGSSMVKTQIAQNALEQDNTLSDHNNQQAATRAANVLLHEHKAATTPNVADCVQANTATQKLQAEPTRLTYLDEQRTKNNYLLNPRVKLFNQAKAAQANGMDYLAPKLTQQDYHEIGDIIGSTPPMPIRTATGECLASGAVYAQIAEKYGFTHGDITDIDSHNTHTGGAVDLGYNSNAAMKQGVNDLIAGKNTPAAEKARQAMNEMASLGANNILYEDFANTKNAWKWNGTTFTDTGKKLDHGKGNHVHVGNTNYDAAAQALANNPNATLGALGQDCAKIEQLTGKSIAQLDTEGMKDTLAALDRNCKKYPYPANGVCKDSSGSMQCKCTRARRTLMAQSGGRNTMLFVKSAEQLGPEAANSASTAGPDTRKTSINILANTGALTGQSGFVIGNKDGGNAVSLIKALASTDFVDPDFKFNKEAVEKTATGRIQVSDHYSNVAKANIQAAIIDEMASYQMPVMQGGKEAMATLVSALLSDNPTDTEKQSVVTLANRMIGPGDTLSVSSLSKIEMMRFASYNYQQNAAMNPSKTGVQFLFVLTKQVQEKLRQLHMLQMINLIKAIELAQNAGA